MASLLSVVLSAEHMGTVNAGEAVMRVTVSHTLRTSSGAWREADGTLSDRLALGGGALHEQRYQFGGLAVCDPEVSRLSGFRASGKVLREPIGRLPQRGPFSLREGLKIGAVHIAFEGDRERTPS